MENRQEARIEDYTELFHHAPARPIKYVKDKDGCGWLCDDNVNPERDLRIQGCWRCDEMVFPSGGR
jgi:hypothetical protein